MDLSPPRPRPLAAILVVACALTASIGCGANDGAKSAGSANAVTSSRALAEATSSAGTPSAPGSSASNTTSDAPPPAVKVGDRAPAFTLQGSDGKSHSLADHAGKQVVILAWFPKAFTGG